MRHYEHPYPAPDVAERHPFVPLEFQRFPVDEMRQRGVGTKLALDMGHLPQSGSGGMMEQLRQFDRQRKILIHINNTNPILHEDSDARAQLDSAGLEVAWDGMRLEL